MILRLTAEELRRVAEQLDALTAMERAGANHLAPNTAITVNGRALAYAHWWEDAGLYTAEIIDFVPGDARPLAYHQ